MERHLDFTIDFETCSLGANAAPMQDDPLPDEYASSDAHDALYDAVRSSWLTWQTLKWLQN